MASSPAEGTAALDKALDLLEAVGSTPDGLGQAALAQRFGWSRTTVYRLLATLVARGLLRRDPLRRVYCLGMRCFERFVDSVRGVAEAGRLRGEVAIAAQVSWAAAHGMVSLLLTQPQFQWSDTPENLKERLLDSLFDGLLKP